MRIRALNFGLTAAVCLASLASATDFDTSTNILAQARLAAADMPGAPDSAPVFPAPGEIRFHAGDIVIDANKNIATVTKTFKDGRDQISYGVWGGTDVKPESSLSISVDSIDGISVNDEVIDANDCIATVKKLFANGQAQAYYKWGGNYIKPARSLAKSVPAIDGLRVNDQIVDADNNIGTVKKLFSNERAQVYYKWGGNYVKPANSLSKSVK